MLTILIIIPDTLGYTSAHKGHQYLVPTYLPKIISHTSAGPKTCSLPWPGSSSPPCFCSHCSLCLGHSFSPLHLDNPRGSWTPFNIVSCFPRAPGADACACQSPGGPVVTTLRPYSFHLWALVPCWPLPLHRKSAGNAETELRQSLVLVIRRGGTIFCQCDGNRLLSFCMSLYSNPWKAKKQLLIKQSIKLYVVIKCHQSTENQMQINRAEDLPSFHMHWSFVFFPPVKLYKTNMLQDFYFILIYF